MSNNINFYDLIKVKKKYHNPNFKKHQIEIPFRMLIIGGSGKGKTNSALNIIHEMSNTFEKIVICCKSACEPLYDYLREKIPDEENLEFYENGEIPQIEQYSDVGQMLIIFDDLVMKKDQSEIAEYFIRGRKVGGGISCMYLTHSYFLTPKIIRLQCQYFILKKNDDKRDLRMILSELGLGVKITELESMYNKALKKETDYFMIDNKTFDDKYKFRKNITPISEINDKPKKKTSKKKQKN